ncbi:MAG: thioredoxin domain-containing protein [Gemmatimonas sp.]|uniref:DsbA family protein n=1 Tax=Gemmatimonas sp. TaxID=1962908 RepID=UPI0031BFF406|nr:thioredoxin domain-containing protein [Gemmatimonas sp.]
MSKTVSVAVIALSLWLAPPLASQVPTVSSDSARADLPLIRRADAARTRGAGTGGAIDTLRPTLHEFVDHACPSCRALHSAKADSLLAVARETRANFVIRVSPIPGLLRGWHGAEAALCAGGLGGADAFDRVHDQLFEQQEQWRHQRNPTAFFLRVASTAKLDSTAYADCLHSGAMRPLVMSDARMAGQMVVEGTPTVLVTRPQVVGGHVRIVGDVTMARVRQAITDALEPTAGVPTPYELVGRWRLDSLDVFRWMPDLGTTATQAHAVSQQSVARTLAEIRTGALVIETVFEPTLRYAHTLVRGDRTVYREDGAWAVPGLTGQVATMTDTGLAGTYHQSRIVARTESLLVLERHFTEGASRGTGERVFLRRQPAAKSAPPR